VTIDVFGLPRFSGCEACEACGEPATRLDCEGVPLCEADYAHLLEHWRLERGP
jgi:hypothetical protein